MSMTEPVDEGRAVPLSKTARTMAKYMSQAWTAPMFGLTAEIDMTAATARKGEGTTITDVVIEACARALKANPKLNAHFRDESIVFYDECNVGLAVANEKGLIVPVIHGAQKLSLVGIGEKRRELIGKVRSGGLKVPDVTGGTFTVSNLGMFDVTRFTAIINPPQVAILAVGSTVQRQVWNGGEPAWRPMAEFTLTSDHRAVDGAAAAGFLQALKRNLEAADASISTTEFQPNS